MIKPRMMLRHGSRPLAVIVPIALCVAMRPRVEDSAGGFLLGLRNSPRQRRRPLVSGSPERSLFLRRRRRKEPKISDASHDLQISLILRNHLILSWLYPAKQKLRLRQIKRDTLS